MSGGFGMVAGVVACGVLLASSSTALSLGADGADTASLIPVSSQAPDPDAGTDAPTPPSTGGAADTASGGGGTDTPGGSPITVPGTTATEAGQASGPPAQIVTKLRIPTAPYEFSVILPMTVSPPAPKPVDQASATSAADPRAAAPAAATRHVASPHPRLIVRTRAQRSVRAGGPVTYVVTVTNPTGAAIHGVTVTEALPGGVALGELPRRVRMVDGVVRWDVGTLAAHRTREMRLAGRLTSGRWGRVCTTARATGDGLDRGVSATACSRVIAVHRTLSPAVAG